MKTLAWMISATVCALAASHLLYQYLAYGQHPIRLFLF